MDSQFSPVSLEWKQVKEAMAKPFNARGIYSGMSQAEICAEFSGQLDEAIRIATQEMIAQFEESISKPPNVTEETWSKPKAVK